MAKTRSTSKSTSRSGRWGDWVRSGWRRPEARTGAGAGAYTVAARARARAPHDPPETTGPEVCKAKGVRTDLAPHVDHLAVLYHRLRQPLQQPRRTRLPPQYRTRSLENTTQNLWETQPRMRRGSCGLPPARRRRRGQRRGGQRLACHPRCARCRRCPRRRPAQALRSPAHVYRRRRRALPPGRHTYNRTTTPSVNKE